MGLRCTMTILRVPILMAGSWHAMWDELIACHDSLLSRCPLEIDMAMFCQKMKLLPTFENSFFFRIIPHLFWRWTKCQYILFFRPYGSQIIPTWNLPVTLLANSRRNPFLSLWFSLPRRNGILISLKISIKNTNSNLFKNLS